MTATNGRVSFGIKTIQSNVTYDDILKIWLEADEEPLFEHAWLWDHFIPLRGPANGAALEAWTLLAALAAQTTETNAATTSMTPEGHVVITTLVACVLLMAVLTAAFTYRTSTAHPHRAAAIRRYR